MSNWALDIGDWGQWYCRYLPFRYFFYYIYIYISPPFSLNQSVGWKSTYQLTGDFWSKSISANIGMPPKKILLLSLFWGFFEFRFFSFWSRGWEGWEGQCVPYAGFLYPQSPIEISIWRFYLQLGITCLLAYALTDTGL